jgi:aconitate hydratase
MIRGTFANIRLRNQLLSDVEGGYTRDFTTAEGAQSFIYEASENYQANGTPLVILAGKEYGSGSSRDWAAKGTALLGVKAVIAESFERIHRSNLIGMGVLPLQYLPGDTAASLGLDGTEILSVSGVTELNSGLTPKRLQVIAKPSAHSGAGKAELQFEVALRIDTPGEADYYRHGGILQYVLRSLVG